MILTLKQKYDLFSVRLWVALTILKDVTKFLVRNFKHLDGAMYKLGRTPLVNTRIRLKSYE